eukprot:TRINITY_DN531_c0_g1_i1.p1 TRINITY_DN531_c0_g1~~TRINITY_DN531_c0_g1_i1.p1  ORF type:complete len:220 (-),score=31.44 TRINITY_DN531_c0_g1_i1:167-826(-)
MRRRTVFRTAAIIAKSTKRTPAKRVYSIPNCIATRDLSEDDSHLTRFGIKRKTIKLFVYGTMKRGFPNYHKMIETDTKYVGQYKTLEKFLLVIIPEYKGVCLLDNCLHKDCPGAKQITGEIFEVYEDKLTDLDIFEGAPHHYVRKRVPGGVFSFPNDSERDATFSEECWVYMKKEYNKELCRLEPVPEYTHADGAAYIPSAKRLPEWKAKYADRTAPAK